jgi:negative regulator of sigma-B (phosphoserine phosphatase)
MESRSSARLLGGIVGYQLPELPQSEPISIRPGHLLVVASDGIAEDHTAAIDFAASAAVTAEWILNQHRRGNDDALVLVARHRGST